MSYPHRPDLVLIVGGHAVREWQREAGLVRLRHDGAHHGGDDNGLAKSLRVVLLPDAAEARVLTSGAPTPRDWAASAVVARHEAYAATCARGTIEGVATSAHAGRWAIASITHADFAWAAALDETAGPEAQGVCVVQCWGGQPHTRLIDAEAGNVVALRRLPVTAADAAIESALESLGAQPGGPKRVCLTLGDDDFRTRVSEIASRVGLRPVASVPPLGSHTHDPGATAAAFAGTGPRFVPPEVIAAAKARNRRRAILSAVAGVALVVGAAVLDMVDLRREMAAVGRARDAHAAQVTALMDAMTHAAELEASVTTLESLRTAHPRWTLLLGSLADGLPENTHLANFTARGDSLTMALEGPDAAAAFEAVRAIPWLGALRSVSPVEREIGNESELTERVSASAVVTWSDFEASTAR